MNDSQSTHPFSKFFLNGQHFSESLKDLYAEGLILFFQKTLCMFNKPKRRQKQMKVLDKELALCETPCHIHSAGINFFPVINMVLI